MKGRNERAIETSIAYIHGRVEAQLEGFAASLGILPFELTSRVASLLLFGSGGEISRNQDHLPKMRGKASKIHQTTRPVEVARGARGNVSRKGKKITHPYWSKLTPEERKAEMTRRMKVRVAKRKAA